MSNNFLNRNLLLHLRLPFSLFLMPVYFFSLSQAGCIGFLNAVMIFISLHFFIYPASNLYNSYMDRDEGAIGGLEKPPPVQKSFFIISILLDVAGLAILLLMSVRLAVAGLFYTLVSRAYSWHGIRLKKYPLTGWLIVSIFQGGYTFYLVNSAITFTYDLSWINPAHLTAALLASLLIGAYYPFTQIYQHDEDRRRGDHTISSRVGVKGTFLFSAIVFIIAVLVARQYFMPLNFIIFLVCLIPVLAYYLYWLKAVFSSEVNADFKHTMRFTALSSACMSICWLILLYRHLY